VAWVDKSFREEVNNEPTLCRITDERTSDLRWASLKLGKPREFQKTRVVLHLAKVTNCGRA
jgi:hypothetical protein